jgi:hypothetical protein
MPVNLQVQPDVREDLAGVQNIPARWHYDPNPCWQEWVSSYIFAQVLIAISPHRRLAFVKTRRGTVSRRLMGTAVRQVFEDSRECHHRSVPLYIGSGMYKTDRLWYQSHPLGQSTGRTTWNLSCTCICHCYLHSNRLRFGWVAASHKTMAGSSARTDWEAK